MGKKTFKDEIDDAALSFISEESIRAAQEDDASVDVGNGTGETSASEDSDVETTQLIKGGERLPKKPPKGFYLDPRFREARSARLQLMVQPTLKARLQKRAKKEHTSVNDLAHTLLEKGLLGDD